MEAGPLAPSMATQLSEAPVAVERGEGPALVFLHGFPLDHRMWEPVVAPLASQHRVLVLDLPGYGLAEGTPAPDSLHGFAEAVHRTLLRRAHGPAVIVGHSFGGYLTLELLREHPEQFAGLVLTNTRSAADTPEAREKRLATVRRLHDPSERFDVDGMVRVLLAPATLETAKPLVAHVTEIVATASSRTIISTLRAIADRPDLTPVLPTIRVPTLVVWGEEDHLIPPGESRAMVPLIPAAIGVEIPRAGHLPSLENPTSFAGRVGEFLGQLPAR